jgi:putative PEP-CTERM system TPR-repeat lipoprotein
MSISNYVRPVALAMLLTGLLAGCSKSPESLLNSARGYLDKNDYNAAIIQLKNALSQKSDFAEARYLLGKAMLDSGDPAAAEVELRKAQSLKYDSDKLVPTLAQAMLASGEVKKILDEMADQKLSSTQAQASLATTIGLAYASQGQFDKAQSQIDKALMLQPNDDKALVAQARMRLVNKDAQGALALLDKAVAQNPSNAEAWTMKGNLEGVLGKSDAAVADYKKAIETNTKYMVAHEALFTAYLRQNKLDEAGKELEQIKQLFPKAGLTKWLETVYAYTKKDYVHARELVEQVLSFAPKDPRVLTMAGAIYLQLHLPQQAEASLNQAIAIQGSNPEPRILLAGLYLQNGAPAKAVSLLEPLVGQTKNPRVLELAGKAYLMNGEPKKANEYFQEAAKLAPENTQDKVNLALSKLALGQKEESLTELEQIAATDKDVTADMALIATALRLKELDRAKLAIDALEKKQPGSPIPNYLRSQVFQAQGDLAKAREYLEKSLSVKQTYAPAVIALANLDISEKKPDDAKRRFETWIKQEPNNTAPYLALAELEARTGAKKERVREILAKATQVNSKDIRSWLALLNYDLAVKDVAHALSTAQNALSANPNQPDLVDGLARAQLASGKSNDAVLTYGKVLSQQPNSPQVLVRMAEYQMAAKQKQDAIDGLKKALFFKSDFLPAQKALVLIHIADGRFDDAIAIARDVQKQRPKEATGALLMGDVLTSQKNLGGAVAAYRDALKLQPVTDIALLLETTLRRAGKAVEAKAFEKSWLQAHPDDSKFKVALAQMNLNDGNYKESIALYQSVLRALPNNPVIMNNLAWAMAQVNDPKAMDVAEQALKLAPKQPAIMDTVAMLAAKKGDTQRAQALLNEAIGIAPDAHAIRLDLAKVLLQVGKRSDAVTELKTLEKLGDKFAGHAEVQHLLAENAQGH